MTYEELNQDLSDLQRAETTVEFMNLFRQMLNEARFFSHDERSLRGYLIEDIEKKKLKAEEFLKTCHLTNRQIKITKQTAIDFANWLDKLTPSQRTSVWSKNGEHQGLFTMDNDQLFERFEKQYTPPVLEQKCVVPNCKKEPIQGAFHGLCSQHIWPNG